MEHVSHVILDGVTNVRDLSWPLATALRPGTRRIFRSACLDRLSPLGLRAFCELRVGLVIDLRGKEEAAAAPQLEGTVRVHLPIEPTVVAQLLRHRAAGTLSAAVAAGVMEDTYRDYIANHTEIFTGVFHHIIEARRQPVLFHCAAGKDRTGVAAALILTALGVPPSVIMEDYLLSNQLYRSPNLGTVDIPDDVREAILKVRPSYLEAAFAAMIEGWGDPDQYLEKALGVGTREREAIREAMT
jgi:protein-tyrosine phosphatase